MLLLNGRKTKLMFYFSFFVIFTNCLSNLAFGNTSKELADAFFYNAQYSKAVNYYLESIDSEKKNSELYYRIGLSYFLLQQPEKSMTYWIEAKKLNSGIFDGRIFRIQSSSMKPTLIIGDHIIIDQDFYKYKKIHRGNIVVFASPENPKKLVVSRVVGIPYDNIEIKNKEVSVNGKRFVDFKAIYTDEKALNAQISNRDNYGPINVPSEKYFMLGDNRDNSHDSRFIGFVDKELIVGRALVIYFSSPDRYSMENERPERSGIILK